MRTTAPESLAPASPSFDSDAILQLSFLEPHFKKIQDGIPVISREDFAGKLKKYADSLKPLLELLAKEIQTRSPTLDLSFLEPHFKKIQDGIPIISPDEKREDFAGRLKKYADSLKPLLELLAKEIQTRNPTLDLSFLELHFKKIQDGIHNISRDEKRKNFAKRLKEYADSLKPLLKLLAKEIQTRNPTFDLSPKIAWEILRRKHIDFLTRDFVENFPEGITHRFRDTYVDRDGIPQMGAEFESSQKPKGVFRNCYYRWGEGLAALRVHTFKIAGSKQNLLELYHHASPVPYEEINFAKRLLATTKNLESLSDHMGPPPSLTEIRLLSPGNPFVNDYQQILETLFGAIRSKRHVSVFVYGINLARINEITLQTRINNLATAQLFEKVFKKLQVPSQVSIYNGSDDTTQVVNSVEESERDRKLFEEAVCAIDLTDGKKACQAFSALLKQQDENERASLEIYQHKWENFLRQASEEVIQSDIVQAFNRFLNLREKTAALTNSKYNGQTQAILIELNRLLGEPVCIGCNDAKDRDGMVSIATEALIIFYHRYKRYPYTFSLPHQALTEQKKNEYKNSRLRDHQTLLDIEQLVCLNSTQLAIAAGVAWRKLASGLSGTTQFLSGYRHLPIEENAGAFKNVYGSTPYPLQQSPKLINGIAKLLEKAQADNDQEKIANIKQSLKNDPLFADIKQLPQYKKLNFLERHPRVRKALIGMGFGVGFFTFVVFVAAIIIFTSGIGAPFILGHAAAHGTAISSLFGISLTQTGIAILGAATFMIEGWLATGFLGGCFGMISNIIKRSYRLDMTPLKSDQAIALLNTSPTSSPSTKRSLKVLNPTDVSANIAQTADTPSTSPTSSLTSVAVAPQPEPKRNEEEAESQEESSDELTSSDDEEENSSTEEIVEKFISKMKAF